MPTVKEIVFVIINTQVHIHFLPFKTSNLPIESIDQVATRTNHEMKGH